MHDHSHASQSTRNHSGHSHSHAPANFGRAFAISISLNILFIVAEVMYGLQANSLALVADAGHNLTDVLGLVMAWGATYLAKCKPTPRYTYGLQSASIIAALANAVLLLVVTVGICWEAIQRFQKPGSVVGLTVTTVAALGVVVNGLPAWLFVKSNQEDLNIKGAFLHLLGDAAISLGVLISGFIILKTGWYWLDPVVSIAISLVIIFGTWGLFRDAVNLTLHAVPAHIDHAEIKKFLASRQDVKAVHDLHIWAMSTTEAALSAHLLMKEGHPGDRFLKHLSHELQGHYRISHATIQIELGDGQEECALAPDQVV